MVQGIETENVNNKTLGKAHKQTILVVFFFLHYIAPFSYLYSRYLTGKRCKKTKKIRTNF